jgi:hypothetical protein
VVLEVLDSLACSSELIGMHKLENSAREEFVLMGEQQNPANLSLGTLAETQA